MGKVCHGCDNLVTYIVYWCITKLGDGDHALLDSRLYRVPPQHFCISQKCYFADSSGRASGLRCYGRVNISPCLSNFWYKHLSTACRSSSQSTGRDQCRHSSFLWTNEGASCCYRWNCGSCSAGVRSGPSAHPALYLVFPPYDSRGKMVCMIRGAVWAPYCESEYNHARSMGSGNPQRVRLV